MDVSTPDSAIFTEHYFEAMRHYDVSTILEMVDENIVCDMHMGAKDQMVIGRKGIAELYETTLTLIQTCTLINREITVAKDCETRVILTFTICMGEMKVFHVLQTINFDGHLIHRSIHIISLLDKRTLGNMTISALTENYFTALSAQDVEAMAGMMKRKVV